MPLEDARTAPPSRLGGLEIGEVPDDFDAMGREEIRRMFEGQE